MARVIAMVIFGSFSLMMLHVGIGQFVQQRTLTVGAKVVEATITKSEVLMSKSSDTDQRLGRDNSTTSYTPEVRFAYEVDGKRHESEMLYPTEIVEGYASAESAAAKLRAFPLNAKVRAHVHPKYPDKGYLIPQKSYAPAVFIVVGLVLPVVTWVVTKWF
jgi:hypothetical protein